MYRPVISMLLCALACQMTCAAELPDAKLCAEVFEQMQAANPKVLGIREYRIEPIDKDYSLFIGAFPTERLQQHPSSDLLGLIVLQGEVPLVLLDALPFSKSVGGDHKQGLSYRLRSVSRGQITIDAPEDYTSTYESRINLFFDLKNKKNLGRKEFLFPCVKSIVVREDTAWCATNAWNETKGSYILKVPLDGKDYKPELVTRIDDSPIPDLTSGKLEAGMVIFAAEKQDFILWRGEWHVKDRIVPETPHYIVVSFPGPPCRTSAQVEPARAREYAGLPPGYKAAIAPEGVAILPPSGEPEFVPIKDFNHDLFRKMRPVLAKDEDKQHFEYSLENQIGGWAVEGEQLIFGTMFYSGEGTEGVGAVGYFDFKSRTYRFEFPPALSPWATPSLLLDGDTLWLGLVAYGEGGTGSGGLLRYNRKDHSTKVFDIPADIGQIVKYKDRLLIGTIDGLYILQGERLTRIMGTVDVDGKPCIEVGRSPKTKEELHIESGRIAYPTWKWPDLP